MSGPKRAKYASLTREQIAELAAWRNMTGILGLGSQDERVEVMLLTEWKDAYSQDVVPHGSRVAFKTILDHRASSRAKEPAFLGWLHQQIPKRPLQPPPVVHVTAPGSASAGSQQPPLEDNKLQRVEPPVMSPSVSMAAQMRLRDEHLKRRTEEVVRCKECGQSNLRKVGKNGPNFGKKFYACNNRAHNFFLWEDEASRLASAPRCFCPFTYARIGRRNSDGAKFYSCPNRTSKESIYGCSFFEWAPGTTTSQQESGESSYDDALSSVDHRIMMASIGMSKGGDETRSAGEEWIPEEQSKEIALPGSGGARGDPYSGNLGGNFFPSRRTEESSLASIGTSMESTRIFRGDDDLTTRAGEADTVCGLNQDMTVYEYVRRRIGKDRTEDISEFNIAGEQGKLGEVVIFNVLRAYFPMEIGSIMPGGSTKHPLHGEAFMCQHDFFLVRPDGRRIPGEIKYPLRICKFNKLKWLLQITMQAINACSVDVAVCVASLTRKNMVRTVPSAFDFNMGIATVGPLIREWVMERMRLVTKYVYEGTLPLKSLFTPGSLGSAQPPLNDITVRYFTGEEFSPRKWVIKEAIPPSGQLFKSIQGAQDRINAMVAQIEKMEEADADRAEEQQMSMARYAMNGDEEEEEEDYYAPTTVVPKTVPVAVDDFGSVDDVPVDDTASEFF